MRVAGSLLFLLILGFASKAQRYESEIFSQVNIYRDVVYGENFTMLTGVPVLEDLLMDIYTPVGDTASDRYLIIMAHSGSFLPRGVNSLPNGEKTDSTMIEMCTQFAKRGWTAAAIDYRLGWNPLPDILGGSQQKRSKTIIQAVYRAMQDMNTAVRFFRKNHTDGSNTYGINPERIVIGGSSSGGYPAVAAGTLNKTSELNLVKLLSNSGHSFISIDTMGTFEGFGGLGQYNRENHPGYSSEAQLIFNLGGAIGDSSWIEPGEAPIINMQGVDDDFTPYKTKVVVVGLTGDPVIEVSGSYTIAQESTADGNSVQWDTVTWTDPYTARARSIAPFEGLFPFKGIGNSVEPWGWYDHTDPHIVDSVEISPGVWIQGTGYGSQFNPLASREKAEKYIDTIMNYFTPRALLVLDQTALGQSEVEEVPYGIRVYPNPSEGMVYLVSETHDPIRSYSIHDSKGALVMSKVVHQTGATINLPRGFYFLEVEMANSTIVEKLVID